MYVPKPFEMNGPEALLEFIRAHSFGVLVSASEGTPAATHVPFAVLQKRAPVKLGLHVARANPHWKTLDGSDVLAIFQGAHAYVSPSWYEQPERSVPTWDYSAVHCAGSAMLASAAVTDRILELLVAQHEDAGGWSPHQADAEYLASMKQAIVGIEITVTALRGVLKYSQNRSGAERERVIANLQRTAPELAADMREHFASD